MHMMGSGTALDIPSSFMEFICAVSLCYTYFLHNANIRNLSRVYFYQWVAMRNFLFERGEE
jgi:hypothetical protein